MDTPDPVTEPQAYQQALLSFLGDDDPAIAQGETSAALHDIVDRAGDDLRTRPGPAAWSSLEAVAHIVQASGHQQQPNLHLGLFAAELRDICLQQGLQGAFGQPPFQGQMYFGGRRLIGGAVAPIAAIGSLA